MGSFHSSSIVNASLILYYYVLQQSHVLGALTTGVQIQVLPLPG